MTRSVSFFLFLFFALHFVQQLAAQSLLLNGNFENNTGVCLLNPTNEVYNSAMENSTAFGTAIGVDVLDETCNYGAPEDGRWFVALGSALEAQYYDAISLQLSTPLISGESYQLTWWDAKSPQYATDKIEFGISDQPDQFGILLDTTSFPDSAWTSHQLNFAAVCNCEYLTMQIVPIILDGWNFLDNINLEKLETGIQNIFQANFSLFPNPATTTITFELPVSKASDIVVFSILGEEVMRQRISSSVSSITLNISSLAKGAYFVVVRNEREVFTSEFIKQ